MRRPRPVPATSRRCWRAATPGRSADVTADRAASRADEWWWFLVDRHLDRMLAIAVELGDELVSIRPSLPDANSAYQIVFHCCGMLEWWTREAVLGIGVDRDRDAEFETSGSVAELAARVD